MRRKVNEQTASLNTHETLIKCPGRRFLQMFELRCVHTRETAKMKSPEPCSTQGVIQHSQSVASVIKLAASDDPQIVQRHEAHRHVGHEHVSLHLHDPLRRQGRELKLHRVGKQKKTETGEAGLQIGALMIRT